MRYNNACVSLEVSTTKPEDNATLIVDILVMQEQLKDTSLIDLMFPGFPGTSSKQYLSPGFAEVQSVCSAGMFLEVGLWMAHSGPDRSTSHTSPVYSDLG